MRHCNNSLMTAHPHYHMMYLLSTAPTRSTVRAHSLNRRRTAPHYTCKSLNCHSIPRMGASRVVCRTWGRASCPPATERHMYNYILGVVYTVEDPADASKFEAAIQQFIDTVSVNVVINVATLTTPDGTVIDMLQDTEGEGTTAHADSPYADTQAEAAAETQTQPSEPREEETAAGAIPTNKEM